jgi:DivIVA domain-containing protein
MSFVDIDNDLARMIREARFTPVRMHAGYSMKAVDHLLDDLVDAVLARRDVRAIATDAHLARSRLLEGYDVGEVDAFLRLVVDVAEGRAPVPPPEPPEPPGLLARLRRRD